MGALYRRTATKPLPAVLRSIVEEPDDRRHVVGLARSASRRTDYYAQ